MTTSVTIMIDYSLGMQFEALCTLARRLNALDYAYFPQSPLGPVFTAEFDLEIRADSFAHAARSNALGLPPRMRYP